MTVGMHTWSTCLWVFPLLDETSTGFWMKWSINKVHELQSLTVGYNIGLGCAQF